MRENDYFNIIKENEKDSASGIAGEKIKESWKESCSEIELLPDAETLASLYHSLGVKAVLSDIDVTETVASKLLECSPAVPNRLTLMRLRKCFK